MRKAIIDDDEESDANVEIPFLSLFIFFFSNWFFFFQKKVELVKLRQENEGLRQLLGLSSIEDSQDIIVR